MCFTTLPGSIYGFNVVASKAVQQLAAKHGVPLHLHAVIYKLIDALKNELSTKLPPLTSENVLGKFSPCTLSPEHLVLTLPVLSPLVAVQVKPQCSPHSTSMWGRKRFLWPAVVFRKVSWTAAWGSGWCENKTLSGRVSQSWTEAHTWTKWLCWPSLDLIQALWRPWSTTKRMSWQWKWGWNVACPLRATSTSDLVISSSALRMWRCRRSLPGTLVSNADFFSLHHSLF